MIIAFMNIVLWVGLSFAVFRPYDFPIQTAVFLGILLGVIHAILNVERHERGK